MIKFFRKIRYDLMGKNKTGMYLKYAIGEIILVVIGILIALGINNLNEKKKNENLGNIFLKDFRSDIITDIETLNNNIAQNKNSIKNIDSILITLSNRTKLSNNELVHFYNQNLALTNESYFIPEKSTIRQFEANSSGHLISSKKLKDKLFNYYSTNDRNENNVERSIQLYQHNFHTKQIMEPVLSGDIVEIFIGNSLNRPNLDLNKLKQNSEYLFSIIGKKVGSSNQNNVYQNMKVLAEELVTMIDKEIEK